MSKLINTMAQPEKVENTEARPGARAREEAIRASVLAALGRPGGLLKVSVLPLWGDKFRVNVWAAGGAGAAIPDSFFVTADDRGAILKTEPPIQKQY
jgi:hypothetical protein